MEQLCYDPITAAEVRTAIEEENERLRGQLDEHGQQLNDMFDAQDPATMARWAGIREIVSFATCYRCRVQIISADGSVQEHGPVTTTSQDRLPLVTFVYTGSHYEAAVRMTIGMCIKIINAVVCKYSHVITIDR